MKEKFGLCSLAFIHKDALLKVGRGHKVVFFLRFPCVAAMLLQVLLWQSQSWHSVIWMRMRWIPAESRKLWLCAITFDGTPEVRFWLRMLWHSADTTPSTHGGYTTFRLAGAGCSSLKCTCWKLHEKGHDGNEQDCHRWLGNGVYAIFNSVRTKHCCVALCHPECVQITTLFFLQFFRIGNLTFRTMIDKNRLYSIYWGKNPSVQALSFTWKKPQPCDDSDLGIDWIMIMIFHMLCLLI